MRIPAGLSGTRRVAAYALVALVLLPACARYEAPGRVLIVGIDGASLERIHPLMEEGRLPNLRRLAEAGAAGPLRSLQPLLSPRIWTTVATGKRPLSHGVGNWVTRPEDGARLMNSHDRKVHALWNIVSDAGLSVATVNWLMTYPPEPVDGVMVSDLARPGAVEGRNYVRETFARAALENIGVSPGVALAPVEVHGPTCYPEEWSSVVAALVREPGPPLTDVPDPFRDNTLLPGLARETLPGSAYEADELLTRVALEVDARTSPDVLMVLLQGIDRSCHWLWGGFEPPEAYPPEKRFTPEERTAAAEAVLAYYDFTDALIGRLLERFDERDLVLVLSDHGFEGGHDKGIGRMSGQHDTERAIDGVLFARGPGIPAGTRIPELAVNVLDITPTVLAWLGLPVADDMHGQPAPFLEPGRPVRHLWTYETKAVPRLPFQQAGVEDTVMEELRTLGYVK